MRTPKRLFLNSWKKRWHGNRFPATNERQDMCKLSHLIFLDLYSRMKNVWYFILANERERLTWQARITCAKLPVWHSLWAKMNLFIVAFTNSDVYTFASLYEIVLELRRGISFWGLYWRQLELMKCFLYWAYQTRKLVENKFDALATPAILRVWVNQKYLRYHLNLKCNVYSNII